MSLLEEVFWLAALVVGYSYLGYGLLISVLAKLRPRPHRKGKVRPKVSLIIAAYNEEPVIREKIINSLCQTYPIDLLEIIVVSDGSTDDTPEIVREYRYDGVISLHQSRRMGKTAAVQRAAEHARGEILVFSDANSMYAPDAIEKLVQNFADPAVGCVAGEKRVRCRGDGGVAREAGLYWKYESYLKRMDSTVSSVVGAAGEIFAVRRSAFQPVETDSFIEDFVMSMRIAVAGHRVVYEPEAISIEVPPASAADEFERRARISAGGFQSIVRLRGVLLCPDRLLVFQYLSHRVLRWAVVPFLLPVLLVTNLALATGPVYQGMLAVQLGLLSLAAAGWTIERFHGRNLRITHVPFYFYMLNVAALVGFFRYIVGQQQVTWRRTSRQTATGDTSMRGALPGTVAQRGLGQKH